jgi:hypothetical protein
VKIIIHVSEVDHRHVDVAERFARSTEYIGHVTFEDARDHNDQRSFPVIGVEVTR